MIDGNHRGISKWIYKCGGGEGERGEGRRGVRKRGRGEGGRGSCKEEGKEVSEFFFFKATKWNLAAPKLPKGFVFQLTVCVAN